MKKKEKRRQVERTFKCQTVDPEFSDDSRRLNKNLKQESKIGIFKEGSSGNIHSNCNSCESVEPIRGRCNGNANR
jgi:hypothetical protein